MSRCALGERTVVTIMSSVFQAVQRCVCVLSSYPVGPLSEVSLRLMGRDAVVSHPCGELHGPRPGQGEPQ